VVLVGDKPRPLGRRYWQLWSSSGLSNVADGVLQVALPLVAITYTTDPAQIAGVVLAGRLPWLLFALQAGAISDRHDRKRVMLVANVGRASILALLAVLVAAETGGIVALYAVAFAIGICETLYDTSAQSIMPQLVDKDQLPRANGRLYAIELTGQSFVGPPLGGVLMAVGAALALGGSSVAWFLAAGVLFLVRGSYRPAQVSTKSIRADIAEGLRFLWRQRVIRAMAVLTGVCNLASFAVFAVFVLYAVGPDSAMKLSEPGYGVLLTAGAVGALGGSLVSDRVEKRLGRRLSLVVMLLLGALELVVPAVTANAWVIAATMVLAGGGVVVGNVVMVSLRQRVTPTRLLGRVNSAYRLIAWGTMPVGAFLGGLLADAFGLVTLFWIAGIVSLLPLVLLVRTLTNATMAAAEQDGD
jgi:MFS family permease